MNDEELRSAYLAHGHDKRLQDEWHHRQLRGRIDAIASEQMALKKTLGRIHRIDVWILVVGSIAAVASVILIVLALLHVA